jgi:hypothetical protein
MERTGVTPEGALAAPDLAELVMAPGPFATVYLTTESAVDNAAQRSEQRWKTMRRELAESGVPENVLADVDPLVPDAHLRGECLCAVGNSDGLLHVAHISEPPRQEIGQWAPLPSLLPLLAWRQQSPPYVLVLADHRGADLVAEGWGVAELQRQAGGRDYPLVKSSPGGWSQRRHQERAENTWEHNADDVAAEVVRLADQVNARAVILAGDVRAVQLIEEALPREVREKVEPVSGGRSPDGSEDMVGRHAQEVVASLVDRDTRALLSKLDEELGQGDRAVEGPAPTLEALAGAQVEVLLVQDDLEDRPAWFGPEPTQLGLRPEYVVGLGDQAPQEAPLVDVAVRSALATGAGLRVVPPGERPRGGMAAILRWSA